jgi:hypothetical protein
LFDTFHTEWTLLVLGPDHPDTTPFESVAASDGLDLRVVHLPGSEILALYEAPMVLIRPDQIVAWRGHTAENAQNVLTQVLGGGATVRA